MNTTLKGISLLTTQIVLTLLFSFIVYSATGGHGIDDFGWEYGGLFWMIFAGLVGPAYFYLPVWVAIAIRVSISVVIFYRLRKKKVACVGADLGISILTSLVNWFILTLGAGV